VSQTISDLPDSKPAHGGELDFQASVLVNVPEDSYVLCIVHTTPDRRRRIQEGTLAPTDDDFELRADLSASVSVWAADDPRLEGLVGAGGGDALTAGDDEFPIWGVLLLLLLLLCCCLLCLLWFCLCYKRKYRPQGKDCKSQLRRGGMQHSFTHQERGVLGLSAKQLIYGSNRESDLNVSVTKLNIEDVEQPAPPNDGDGFLDISDLKVKRQLLSFESFVGVEDSQLPDQEVTRNIVSTVQVQTKYSSTAEIERQDSGETSSTRSLLKK